jgi:hypothetical protein
MKRANTSFEEEGNIQKRSDMETPPWDTIMQKLDRNSDKLDSVIDSVKKLQVDVAKQAEALVLLSGRVDTNAEAIDGLQMTAEDAGNNYSELKQQIVNIQEQLDTQIDGSLRSHLTLFGLKKHSGGEREWDDTKSHLAKWLADHTDKGIEYYLDSIDRAHRGNDNPSRNGPPPVHVKFLRWSCANFVARQLGMKVTEGVRVSECYSKGTQKRRDLALIQRRQMKDDQPADKLFVRYPAKLVKKSPGDARYKLVKEF